MIIVLIGYLFMALDVLASFGSGGVIELPPDFVGYLLIAFGMSRMKDQSRFFTKAISFGVVGAILAGFVFFVRLLSLSYTASTAVILLEVAEIVMMMIVLYLVIRGLRDVEAERGLQMYGNVMKWLWVAMFVILAASYAVQIFDVWSQIATLATDLISLAIFLFLYNGFQTIKEAGE